MRRNIACWLCLLVAILARTGLFAQTIGKDTVHLDYRKIYAYCLDGNIRPALLMVDTAGRHSLSPKDRQFATEFDSRFRSGQDNSNYLASKRSPIDSLLQIYHAYWRTGLLDTQRNDDTTFTEKLVQFLKASYGPARALTADPDSIDLYEKGYLGTFGFHTTGFGKTGKFFDLLVWRKEEDTTYNFMMGTEKISAHVVFMDDFITLGWEEFATLEKYYPGGWATSDALYCVKKAYDLNSEQFLISYLAHESRHFADYKLFPGLQSADLEYRAKLTELSLAKTSLYETIEFFISNANKDSDNGHSVADYRAIRDLSKKLFKKEFEKNILAWKKLDPARIHSAAAEILQANTTVLRSR